MYTTGSLKLNLSHKGFFKLNNYINLENAPIAPFLETFKMIKKYLIEKGTSSQLELQAEAHHKVKNIN